MGMAQNLRSRWVILYTSLYMSQPGSFLGHFYLIIAKFLLPWSLMLSHAHIRICMVSLGPCIRAQLDWSQNGPRKQWVPSPVSRCLVLQSPVAEDQICNQSRDQACQPPKPAIRQSIASSIFVVLQYVKDIGPSPENELIYWVVFFTSRFHIVSLPFYLRWTE